MKIDSLINIMQAHSIKLPNSGTGRSGQIVARDLENAIGDYYLAKQYPDPFVAEYHHICLRRAWTPMKAYRFNLLNDKLQREILEDDNDWYAERKLNGWRMMVTFIPGTTPMFWGGNLSTVDFLPTNYTKHVLFKTENDTLPVTSKKWLERFNAGRVWTPVFDKDTFILDCEVVVKDKDEDISEHASLIQVQEILGSSPDRARRLQAEATLQFKVFDVIEPAVPDRKYISRKNYLSLDCMGALRDLELTQFSMVPHYSKNKKQYVNKIWKEGGEGVILKHGNAHYKAGSRLRTHQIKVKRTHSGAVGDDVDAFISRIYNTPEWSKKNLIGGVELSLYLRRNNAVLDEHIVAAVTSLPDDVRLDMTQNPDNWLNKVFVVDGQELSARNRRLLHAKVDWQRGERMDKSPTDCEMELQEIEGVKF